MATTLYLRATAASEPKPNVRQSTVSLSKWITSTLGGGQDGAGAIYPLDMLTAAGSNEAQSVRETSAELGVPYYTWYKAWISPPLAVQTITGTLTVVFDWNQGASQHNIFPRIKVYVWKGDDTGVRGVLYAETNSAVEADDLDASLQTFFSSVTLTNIGALTAGDRIVIEVQGYDNNTKTASYLHAINFDGAVGGNRNSNIQFSQTLLWQPSTYTKTFTADAILVKTYTKTFTADSLLKKTQTKTFTSDSLLKKTQTKTFTADAILQSGVQTYTKTFTADAILKQTLEKTFTADSLLKKTQVKTFTADAILVKTYTKTFTADSLLKKTQTKTFTSDSLLKKTQTKTFTADSFLKKTLTKTFTADAVLVNRYTKTFTADSFLKKTLTKTFTADAVLVNRYTKTFAADSILKKTQTKTFTADSILVKTYTKTFTADALLTKRYTKTFTADSLLKKTQTKTFTADALLTKRYTKTFTADAILKGFTTWGSPFLYTAANWGAGVKFYLEVYMRLVSGGMSAEGVHARLLNITDNTEVSGSEISTLDTTLQRLRTPELTLTDGKEYRVQFGKCGSDQGAFVGAKLVAI